MFKLHTKGISETVTLKNLPTMRQAFVVASILIILGYVLGALVHPYFELLPLLVAGGLMFSGLSGVCPMVLLVQMMPWNKTK